MKLENIKVEFLSLQKNEASRPFIADIALIDRAPPSAVPVVYTLNEQTCAEDWISIQNGFSYFHQKAFSPLGEAFFIDKKNKKIILKNQDVLFYKRLIIVNGMQAMFQDKEFWNSLQTLIHALRVQKIPQPFSYQTENILPPTKKTKAAKKENVLQAPLPYFLQKQRKIDKNLSAKRLYEVQI